MDTQDLVNTLADRFARNKRPRSDPGRWQEGMAQGQVYQHVWAYLRTWVDDYASLPEGMHAVAGEVDYPQPGAVNLQCGARFRVDFTRLRTDPEYPKRGRDDTFVPMRFDHARGMVLWHDVGHASAASTWRPAARRPPSRPTDDWLDPEYIQKLNAAEAFRGYFDAQDGGSWFVPIPVEEGEHFNAYQVELPEAPQSHQELLRLLATVGPLGLVDVIHLGDSLVILTSFVPPDPTIFETDGVRSVRAAVRAAANCDAIPIHLEARYIPYEDQWGLPDGSDAVTLRMLELVSPEQEDSLSSPPVRERVLAHADHDDEWSRRLGTPVRQDLQNARRIFGADGFAGLKGAIGKGILP